MKSKQFALLRIAFGCVWAIDAWFKWQPAFWSSFLDNFTGALDGQPTWVQAWLHFWIALVSVHTEIWILILALAETAIAIGLIFGLFTRVALMGGAILALLIWAVPEGFGGPYMPGMTDIGTGIIYVFVFAALWIGASWRTWSLDALWRDAESS